MADPQKPASEAGQGSGVALPGTVPVKQILAIALALSFAMFLYSSVLTTVQVHVRTQPDALLSVPGSTVEVRVEAVNRLGWRVPFAAPRLRCEVIEGGELVTLRSTDDSTAVIVESTGLPGAVELRVFTPASAFPLFARIPILAPLALGPTEDARLRSARAPSAERRSRNRSRDGMRPSAYWDFTTTNLPLETTDPLSMS